MDRFGQQAREVRTLMLYGEDNPVDGAVLKVILRKAETIRKELGVLVPMPDDEAHITQALMNAVLLHRRDGADAQLSLEFGAGEQDVEQALETAWRNASERIARNTSIFAQRRLKPEDVLPDWRRTLAALGDDAEVERFVRRTAQRLGASPRPEGSESSDGDVEAPRSWRFPLQHLPAPLVDRYAAEGLEGVQHICFRRLAGTRARFVHRTHPLVSLLADHVLETALQQIPASLTESDTVAVRSAALFTTAVQSLTTVWLLRVRHQISVTRRIGNTDQERTLLAEETLTLVEDSAAADAEPFRAEPDRVEQLLAAEPARNMADGHCVTRHVRKHCSDLPERCTVSNVRPWPRRDTLLRRPSPRPRSIRRQRQLPGHAQPAGGRDGRLRAGARESMTAGRRAARAPHLRRRLRIEGGLLPAGRTSPGRPLAGRSRADRRSTTRSPRACNCATRSAATGASPRPCGRTSRPSPAAQDVDARRSPSRVPAAPLLRDVLGFTDLEHLRQRRRSASAASRSAMPAADGRVPVVIGPHDLGLDTADPRFGEDGRRRSAFRPAAGVPERRRRGALWALVSNGRMLRIVRDNPSLTRPA